MALLRVIRIMERYFLVTLFLLMVFLFSINVFIREFGGIWASDFAWIEEAVRLMNIFLVFGVLGLALERGRHVGIDSFREKLPPMFRNLVLKFIDLCGLLFSLYFVFLSWDIMTRVLASGQRSPTLDVPIGWIYAAPFVGFMLLGLRFLLSLTGIIDRYSSSTSDGDLAEFNENGSGGKP